MTRRATKTEQTGAAAISGAKGSFISIGWGPMENNHHDLGTDLVIWVRDGRLFDLGLIVGAQVKGGKSYFGEVERSETGEIVGWWYREDSRSHFDSWSTSSVPHLLILHDLDAATSYWVHVTQEAIVPTGKGAKILVPKDNTVDSEHLGELIKVAAGIRSKVSWEGTAWTESIPVSPESAWRHALIVPRLIAPHPNAGVGDGLSEQAALAMVTQVRLPELTRICDESEEAPSLDDAEKSEKWGWRLVGAFVRYLTSDDPDSLVLRTADSPSPAGRAAAAVAAAGAMLDLGRPEDALRLIGDVIATDESAPVDHAWLRMQQARVWAEVGRIEEARATAMELLPIGATVGDDVTATALAGAAAALIFNTSAWGERDLQEVIAAGDTVAGWWREQVLSWGLGDLAERDFVAWGQDRSITIGGEDLVAHQLTAASLMANHAADHGGWRYARGLLGRDGLIRLDRHGDPTSAAAGLELLRIAGDSRAIKRAAVKVAIDGPARALTLAAARVHLERSTSTTAMADLTLLQQAGDLMDASTANRCVAWLLATLEDPRDFAKRITPSFLLVPQLAESLAGLVPAADESVQTSVIKRLVTLQPQGDQVIATAWARVVLALPESIWTDDQAREAGAQADAHNFALQMPLLGVAAAHDPAVRDRLRGEVAGGSARALGALGDVTTLPKEAVVGLISKLAEEVRGQISEAHSGVHGIGQDVARTLALVNMWHPAQAEWDPLYEQLADDAVMAGQKHGAVALMASAPHRLPSEVKERLVPIVAVLASESSRRVLPFDNGPAFTGASVKLALALGALGETEGRERLLALLAGAETERRWAAHAVAARGDQGESPLLIGLLQDPDPSVRATAAGALAQMIARKDAGNLATLALRRALTDPGTWVATSVIGVLAAEVDLSPEAREIVNELLSHPSARVRTSAAQRAAGQVA